MSVREDRRLRAVKLTGLTAAPDLAFDALARAAASALRAPICLISLLDAERQFFPGACGMPSPLAEDRSLPLTETLCRMVIESGRPLIFTDGPSDPRVADNLMVAEFGVVAYMGLPLTDDDGLVLGSLCVVELERRDWTEHDHAVLAALAEACCAELRSRTERTRAEAAGGRAVRLGTLAAALAGAQSVEDVTGVLALQVQEALDCQTFSLRMVLPELGVARAVELGGTPIDYQARFNDIRLDRPSAVAEVVTTRQAVFLRSAEENRERYGHDASLNHEAALIAGLARLPMLVEGDLVGVLSVGYWHRTEFPPEDRLFLTTIADLAAQALGRAMRTERVRRLQSLSDLALSRLSLPELAADLGDRLTRMFRASGVALFLHEPQRLRLRPLNGIGDPVPLGRGMIGGAIAANRTVVLAMGRGPIDPSDSALSGFGSVVIAPLVLEGELVGAMVVGRERSGPFSASDVDLLAEAAPRVALAVDRGLAFERQRELARTLQSALLPPVLPGIPGMRTASVHQAAGAGIEVGGDFYDVFGLGDGAWLAVIGDVRGRGPAAAVLTGLIRHTIRAVAVEERDPAAILARTNAIVFDETGPEDFATIVCVRVRPTPGRTEITLASAGHCAPLIVRNDSADLEVVEAGGMILGAFEDIQIERVQRSLWPGDVLVLHTDGLTESLGAVDRFGDERLLDLLGTLSGHSPEQMVDVVHQAVLRHSTKGECEDDLALLALGVTPAGDDEPVQLLEHAMSHGLHAAADARRAVAGLALPSCLLENLRFVVSELVSNAAKHGQPGCDITLRVFRQGTRVRVEVRNAGAPFAVPEEFDPLAESGRGLHLVRSLTARMGVGRERGRALVWCEFDPEPAAD